MARIIKMMDYGYLSPYQYLEKFPSSLFKWAVESKSGVTHTVAMSENFSRQHYLPIGRTFTHFFVKMSVTLTHIQKSLLIAFSMQKTKK